MEVIDTFTVISALYLASILRAIACKVAKYPVSLFERGQPRLAVGGRKARAISGNTRLQIVNNKEIAGVE